MKSPQLPERPRIRRVVSALGRSAWGWGRFVLLPLAISTCRVGDVLDPFETRVVEIEVQGATLAVADSTRLTASVRVDGQATPGVPLVWSSSDPSVASVDATGQVVARRRGRAEIVARLAPSAAVSVAAEARDTVLTVIAGLDLAPGDTTLTSVGDTLCVRPTPRDARGAALDGLPVTLAVRDDPDSTLRVAGGCVIASRPGRPATLEASLDTSRATATVTITQVVASIALTPPAGPLGAVGDTASVTPAAFDRRGNPVADAAVAWSSSDTAVVAVDSQGILTARGAGSARVRGAADAATDSVTVTVTPPILNVSPGALTAGAAEGSAARRHGVIRITNGGTGALTWSAARLQNAGWNALAPESGTQDSLVVTFDPAGLAAGTYLDTVVITAPGADESPDTVALTFTVSPCAQTALTPDTATTFDLTDEDCGAPNRTGRFARVFTVSAAAGDSLTAVLTGTADAFLIVTDPAGGVLASNDTCPVGPADGACLDHVALGDGVHRIEATTAGPGATGTFTLSVSRPSAPAGPAAPDQRRTDGTTSIAPGATTSETDVVFQAALTDPDPFDSLRLEVEVAAVGTAFTGAVTATSTAVAAGDTATVRIGGLSADTDYHWRTRARDRTGRAGPWVNFGGNAETAADFRIDLPDDPDAAGSLAQRRSDGVTALAVGDTVDDGQAVLRAVLTDPDAADSLSLEIEIQLLGDVFSGTPTHVGARVANGETGQVLVSGLADDTAYHWQARAADASGRTGPWTAFGGNAESAPDLHVSIPEDPDTPATLAQLLGDSATAIGTGSTITGASVVFRGDLADPDPGATLTLEVELQPVGVAFTGTATATSSGVAGGPAHARVDGLSDDTDYHWQARTRDGTGRTSAWVSFGGNAESAADFAVAVPENPDDPGALAQFLEDGATPLATGDTTVTATVVLQAAVSDPDPDDTLTLEVEVRPVGVAFTGTATHASAPVLGATAGVSVPGLSDDTPYHWQARVLDQTGRTSGWVSFGGNAESADDFHVAVPQAPASPTALAQLEADTATVIPVGASAGDVTVVFTASVTDPDPGDSIVLQVEARPLGVAFTGTPTASGTAVTSGGTAAVRAQLADDTNYHWRARSVDGAGQVSAWVSFGGNSETAADFNIPSVPENPDPAATLSQFAGDSVTAIPVGDSLPADTAVFSGVVTDNDAADVLRLQVEVQPVGTPFTGMPTDSSATVADGATAFVRIGGLTEDLDYHWQARVTDQTGRAGPWSSFGGNAEGDSDFRVAVPEDPNTPTGLDQRRSDGTTSIALGATHDEATAVFRASVTDPDPGDVLRLQVEVQPVGTPFTDTPTATGATGVASGNAATVTIAGLSDDTPWHWQVRTIDQTGRTSAWTSFGGNAESATDFATAVPDAPDAPAGLGQFLSNGTTVAVGDTVAETTFVFRGTATDGDPGAVLRLQVEVQPVGMAFTGTPTDSSGTVASGANAEVTIALSEDVSYHWRARVSDETGRASAWTSFGGNADGDTDFHSAIPEDPDAPASLGQFAGDSTTAVGVGGTLDAAVAVVSASVTDPDPDDTLTLEVELRRIGTAFTDVATHTSAVVPLGGTAFVRLPALEDDSTYHWQARVVDRTGRASAWTSFGGNAESAADFGITIPEAPAAPSGLGQFLSNGSTAVAVGDTVAETTFVFRGTVTDGDPGAVLRLQVEVQPVGMAFTGTPTDSSGTVASGASADVTVGLGDDTGYHWRARVTDETGRASAWTSFGGNADGATDFRATVPEDPSLSALAQFAGDSTTAVGIGGTLDAAVAVVSASLTDPDPEDTLTLEVELRKIGTAFTDVATHTSAVVPLGGTAFVRLPALEDDSTYHWQARVVDQTGRAGAWTSFGGNAESATDFAIAIPETPATPVSLEQRKSDSTTVLGTGATTDEATLVFQAAVTDPDPGAAIRLQVEIQPVGVAFTNTPTATGSAVASGAAAVTTVTGLADDTDFHWQVRAIDDTDSVSAWQSFGANAESAADVSTAVPEDPGPASGLGQFLSDGTTAVAVGDTVAEATFVFRGTVTDPDPGATLRLQVEVRPVGMAFTGTPTDSSSQVASGADAPVTIAGLSDDVDYHWRARATDGTGRAGPWGSFGGNADGDTDFRSAVPEDPAVPATLGQFKADSSTAIASADTTDESSVVFGATITDPDAGDMLELQVEVQTAGQAFTGTPTATSAPAASGASARVRVDGLTDDRDYHWRVRTRDQTGRTSAWVAFGGPTDFHVAVPQVPAAPTGATQLLSDGSTTVAVGDTVGETTLVFRATVSDPDPADTLRIEVEIQPVGTAFTGVGTFTSTPASGSTASDTITVATDDTDYHWRVRTVDHTGRMSAWVSFGGNAESEADFRVEVPQDPVLGAGNLNQFESDGTTAIPVGGNSGGLSVILRGLVSDPDPGDVLTLEVEVRPTLTAFTNVATGSVGGLTSGQTGSVTFGGVVALTSYHWQARVCDDSPTPRCSAWVSFGGNAETAADFVGSL